MKQRQAACKRQDMAGWVVAMLLLALAMPVRAQTTAPQRDGVQEASVRDRMAASAKALTASISGASPQAMSHPSALDILLGHRPKPVPSEPVRLEAKASRQGESAAKPPSPGLQDLLRAPGCSQHVVTAGSQLLSFARAVQQGVQSNPNAGEFLKLQRELGIDVNALLAQAGNQLRQMGAAGSARADINQEVKRCLDASGIAKQALSFVDTLPASVRTGLPQRGALNDVAAWAESR